MINLDNLDAGCTLTITKGRSYRFCIKLSRESSQVVTTIAASDRWCVVKDYAQVLHEMFGCTVETI